MPFDVTSHLGKDPLQSQPYELDDFTEALLAFMTSCQEQDDDEDSMMESEQEDNVDSLIKVTTLINRYVEICNNSYVIRTEKISS